MPYESFKSAHHVAIRGVVQDPRTGTWRYELHVHRFMTDDARWPHTRPSSSSTSSTMPPKTLTESDSKQRHTPDKMQAPLRRALSAPPVASGTTQVYTLRRSFSEFKRLHAAISPSMAMGASASASPSSSSSSSLASGGAAAAMLPTLPPLPEDTLFAFFVGETQAKLQRKRVALERMLHAIESHPVACDAACYHEFLAANTDTYEQFNDAPVSPVATYRARSFTDRAAFDFSISPPQRRQSQFLAPSMLPISSSSASSSSGRGHRGDGNGNVHGDGDGNGDGGGEGERRRVDFTRFSTF